MMIREAKKEENSIIADIWLMSMRSAHYGFKETYWTKQYKSIRIKYSQVRSDVYVYEDGGCLLYTSPQPKQRSEQNAPETVSSLRVGHARESDGHSICIGSFLYNFLVYNFFKKTVARCV